MSLSMFANVDEYRESLKVDDDKRAEQYSSPVAYAQGIRQKLGDSVQVKPIVHYSLLIHRPKVRDRAVIIPIDHPATYLNGQRVTTSTVVSVDENGKDFDTLNTRYVFEQQAATNA